MTTRCAACGQANPPEARFCLACGTPLAAEASARPAEERRVVTAVFTDVVGSTASAEQLDPEDVHARLTPYFARVRNELESVGGTVEKFIGDAVVAVFGAPQAHEDDPERAVRAALAIRTAIAELNEADPWLDLHVRVGVATGESLVTLGKDARSEGIASGDVMNTAARIQSGAPENGVLVDEETYRTTSLAIEYRPAEPLAAKGKSEPVLVWEAVVVRAHPGDRPTLFVPFVGRERELGLLRETWSKACASRERALFTVLAAPGVGKSRLVTEFEASAPAVAQVYRGRCLPYGEGITYWPVSQIVRRAAGILGSDEHEVVSTKLGSLLESLPTGRQDELRTVAAALANLVGAPRTPAGTYTSADISQAELHWGIRRLLELLATRQQLVIVFEDLHWAEETLLELLRFIVDGSVPAPLLIIGTARPELAERAPAILVEGEHRHVVELLPLTGNESEALLAELTVEQALPTETLEALMHNAEGNPLFLEETVRMLAESSEVELTPSGLPVPTTLQGLLGARLDQLPATERAVAQHAAVVGTVFWSGAVASLDGFDEDTVGEALRGLERRDVIHAQTPSTIVGEREYAFKHVLIHDVAYARLPKRRRVLLHSRFAGWVEQLPGGHDELVEIVAYHLEQACRAAAEIAHSPEPPPVLRAALALAQAAEKAERREGFREADAFYARALDVLDDGDREALVELQLKRSRTLAALGELGKAHDELVTVAEAAAELGRLNVRCAALIAMANIDSKQGRAAESRRNLTEAVAIAGEIGDRALQVQAGYEFAWFAAWFEGADEASALQLGEALAIAEELDDLPLRIEGHLRIGTLCFNVGNLVGAQEACERSAELASEIGSFRDETKSITLLSLIRYYRGELDEAERLALQALEWLERTADTHLQLQNLRELARCALARGDLGLAEERLRTAVPLALEAGGWLVIEIYRYLTETLVRQGRVEEARELVDFAARNLPPEDAYAQAALALARASVATADSHQGDAVAHFDEALRLLREQRLLTDLGEARIAFARALRSFGEHDDARAELERAREEFARMDARELVAQIDRELAQAVTGADSVGPVTH
jgi:class 3 adenylate cyclase/tetratricopeptide (TPR) repeat protein